MKFLNDKCLTWRGLTNISFSLYGTPMESTTYKFAQCLQRRFGIIPHVTDKSYITNSYHVHVTEPIDAFSKLAFEAEFQELSPGGAISYPALCAMPCSRATRASWSTLCSPSGWKGCPALPLRS